MDKIKQGKRKYWRGEYIENSESTVKVICRKEEKKKRDKE